MTIFFFNFEYSALLKESDKIE